MPRTTAPAGEGGRAASPFALGRRAVHVWSVPLDSAPARIYGLWNTLSADERARAMAFRREGDRLRFVAARGSLRLLLGRYLDRAPGALEFGYGPRGKPELAGEGGGAELRFNLSHAGELAVIAVARGRAVGVDVERLGPGPAAAGIARTALSAAEKAALGMLAGPARGAAVFRAWSRKEAVVKALGEGLSLAPDRVAVSLGQQPALFGIAGDAGAAARWRLVDLDLSPGYVGALAGEGRGWRLAAWQWPSETAGGRMTWARR